MRLPSAWQVRPLALQSWCERGLPLGAGKRHVLRIELRVPCVLLYRFSVPAHDVIFQVSGLRKRGVYAAICSRRVRRLTLS